MNSFAKKHLPKWCLTAGLALGLACGESKPKPLPPPASEARFSDLSRQTDGRVLLKSTGVPFTGSMKETWPSGRPRMTLAFKDGWQHGPARGWHENGEPGLKGEWKQGKPVGVMREWTPDGLAVREVEYRDGKIIREQTAPTSKAQDQIQAKLRQRKALDEKEWQAEIAAQEYEATFVDLWDRLRRDGHPWEIFQKFPFETITLPRPEPTQAHDWGIKEMTTEKPGESFSFVQWQERLANWSKTHRVVETEWHQEQFTPPARGAQSLFKVVIHAEANDQSERLILRATVRVKWADKKNEAGHWLPRQLEVTRLTLLRRRGPVPFKESARLLPRRGNPSLAMSSFPHTVDPAPLLVRDLNGDGLPEIITTGSNLIYRNQGGLKFRAEPMLHGVPGPFPNASAIADFNGDGHPDLLTFGHPGKSLVFRGDGQGRFSVPPVVGLASIENTQLTDASAVAVGDVDGDGDLDAFVPQYLYPYAGGRTPTPYYDSRDGLPAYLLINDGTGKFSDGTLAAGLGPKRHRRTYSASLVDLNEDGKLDLVVVSDFAGLDLYLNNGEGKFTDITARLGESRYSFGMSHALGDFNGDGRLDVYMTGMGSTTARRLEHLGLGRKGFESIQAARMKMGYGNRLLLGDGKGGFQQTKGNEQVARTGWAWGCTQWDFDNDGDRDLFIANGHISGKSAKDYCSTFWRHDIYTPKIQNPGIVMQGLFQECKTHLGKTESWNGFEHNVLFLNGGRGRHTNIAFLMGLASEADSRSVVAADLDLDGRPDLLVVEIENISTFRDGHVRILRNQLETGNNWVGVRVQGANDAIPFGAKVTVYHTGTSQSLPLITGDSWKAQHPAALHFGLGKAKSIEAIEVRWPDGKTTQLEAPEINRYHVIKASP